MVKKDLVAKAHFFQISVGFVVAHSVPKTQSLPELIVPGPLLRLGFDEPVSYGNTFLKGRAMTRANNPAWP
jgi:hypothetical protein